MTPQMTSGIELALKMKNMSSDNVVLVICDMQERFRSSIPDFSNILYNCRLMLKCANILNIPIVVAEMYPKGAGPTVKELEIEKYNVFRTVKSSFSVVNENVVQHLKEKCAGLKSIMLCGIAAHVCVFQSCVDFILEGYDVFLISDACSASTIDRKISAFSLMERMGAITLTVECVMLSMVKGRSHPNEEKIRHILLKKVLDAEETVKSHNHAITSS